MPFLRIDATVGAIKFESPATRRQVQIESASEYMRIIEQIPHYYEPFYPNKQKAEIMTF